ncbi:uncharacterized protein HMPREF1541_00429 [Cyphellophora europaea CBS 101466]|uniref:Uncharacterized protein n=1 Tax=Cyphellophora europaea (strain CBS 101466) TaxID=1220924 RepID=W2SCB2_CYPE1|nr:uncharacterized protein HMPREF1541_00429 [Cyphellophora europaea CBS 101466]ETN46245.1 hypothetical protein HMPREF1541_00429 [Cyphellophora europaea CBS 101466]
MQFLEPLTRKPAEIPILCRAYIGGDTDKIKREAARLSRRTAEAHAAPVAETAVYWAYLGGAAEAEAAHLPKRAAEANANANANAAPVAETAVYWAYLEEAEKLED